LYDFEGVIYAVFEYIDFTLQDVLQISPSLTEQEIAHIIHEVRDDSFIWTKHRLIFADFDWGHVSPHTKL
jgi:hypothetical protein